MPKCNRNSLLIDHKDKYTIEVENLLIDPGAKIFEMINQTNQMEAQVNSQYR